MTARWHLICQRDALTCGLGWPHRGEPVTISTWCYNADGAKVASRKRIYLGSSDIFNVGHGVWLPACSGDRCKGTVRVGWSRAVLMTGRWALPARPGISDYGSGPLRSASSRCR